VKKEPQKRKRSEENDEVTPIKTKKTPKKKVQEEAGSVEKGLDALKYILSPINVERFFIEFWEKKPLHVQRQKSSQYYKHIFSTKEFDSILRSEKLLFGKNLDVTSYDESEGRQTHNPSGLARAPVVWDYYGNGCSLRLINPQVLIILPLIN